MTRKLVLLALSIALGGAILCQVSTLLENESLATKIVDDFSQYWAAGRLNATSGNPYSSTDVYALQLAIQPQKDRPTLMWNPPWTLPLAMPFGMLPYAAARLLWFAVHLAIMMGCIVWLWKFYLGAPPHWIWMVALVLGFPPAVNALGEGQISAFILLAVVGFLHFERQGRPDWAGVCAALALIKPHLLLLFWVALLYRALYQRSFKTLIAASISVAFASAVALAFNPHVFHQYFDAVRHSPPYYWVPPTFGALLRMTFGWDKTWLSFVPGLMGVLWVVGYCHARRQTWRWKDHLSAILLVSVMVTAYGWIFDQIVFLIPVIYAAQWVITHPGPRAKWVTGAYVVTCLFGFYVTAYQSSLVADYQPGVDTSAVRELAFAAPNSFWCILVPPVLLLAHFSIQRHKRRFPASIGMTPSH